MLVMLTSMAIVVAGHWRTEMCEAGKLDKMMWCGEGSANAGLGNFEIMMTLGAAILLYILIYRNVL
jgi:hypothetical protein